VTKSTHYEVDGVKVCADQRKLGQICRKNRTDQTKIMKAAMTVVNEEQ